MSALIKSCTKGLYMSLFAVTQHQTQSPHSVNSVRAEHAKSRHVSAWDSSRNQPQAWGNQALQRLLRTRAIQAKLKVNEPGDKYEQEADRVADEVMRMPQAPMQRDALPVALRVQRRFEDSSAARDAPSIVNDVLASPGQPLDPSTRSFFEARLGYDFGHARVHNGARAAESARAVGARTYTIGQNVVFATSEYAPQTFAGRRLLAHELSHVLQQRQSSAPPPEMLQRTPKFTNCRTAPEGTEDPREKGINAAADEAKRMAGQAQGALKEPIGVYLQAVQAHFGALTATQKNTVIDRYGAIEKNMDDKAFECKPACPNPTAKRENCAEGETPGNKIYVCPLFESSKDCGDPAITVLHEAAHNAGATLDVDRGTGYPPAAAEDNAYSYEHFAKEAAKGPLGTLGPIAQPRSAVPVPEQ